MKITQQPIWHLVIFTVVLMGGVILSYFTQAVLKQTAKITTEVGRLVENRDRLGQLGTLWPSYSRIGNVWKQTLPSNEKEVAAFAGKIEQLAKDQKLFLSLTLDDFPGPVDISGHYIAGVGAAITLEGSYSGLTVFLGNLERLPYYFKIDKLVVTKADTKVGIKAIINGSLMMNIEI